MKYHRHLAAKQTTSLPDHVVRLRTDRLCNPGSRFCTFSTERLRVGACTNATLATTKNFCALNRRNRGRATLQVRVRVILNWSFAPKVRVWRAYPQNAVPSTRLIFWVGDGMLSCYRHPCLPPFVCDISICRRHPVFVSIRWDGAMEPRAARCGFAYATVCVSRGQRSRARGK